MRKLKKQKLHAIYITIFTVMICAILWTDMEWQKIVSIATIPTILIAALFDKRYRKLFD